MGSPAHSRSSLRACGLICFSQIGRPTLSCVWDSSVLPEWVLGGEPALWHQRWKLMARAVRLGYNVMSVDLDSVFFRDPYTHLKRPPLSNVQVRAQVLRAQAPRRAGRTCVCWGLHLFGHLGGTGAQLPVVSDVPQHRGREHGFNAHCREVRSCLAGLPVGRNFPALPRRAVQRPAFLRWPARRCCATPRAGQASTATAALSMCKTRGQMGPSAGSGCRSCATRSGQCRSLCKRTIVLLCGAVYTVERRHSLNSLQAGRRRLQVHWQVVAQEGRACWQLHAL